MANKRGKTFSFSFFSINSEFISVISSLPDDIIYKIKIIPISVTNRDQLGNSLTTLWRLEERTRVLVWLRVNGGVITNETDDFRLAAMMSPYFFALCEYLLQSEAKWSTD